MAERRAALPILHHPDRLDSDPAIPRTGNRPWNQQPPSRHTPRSGIPAQPDSRQRQPENPANAGPGTATAPGYTAIFDGRAEEAARVRREIAAYLGTSPPTDDIILITSELAANAILHTRSRTRSFCVRCQPSPRSARIEVEDLGGPWRPRQPGDRSHGLDIVQALTGPDGWGTQAHLGRLMGWPAASTVCAAEGHRGGRQRRFARWEIAQLAAIFGIPAAKLLTRCVTCGGQPPPGYACLACKAEHPTASVRPAAAR